MVAKGEDLQRKVTVQPRQRFNGVKVFSATMNPFRAQLGDKVTAWIAQHTAYQLIDIVVTQSSDSEFHCIAISVFYWETPSEQRSRA